MILLLFFILGIYKLFSVLDEFFLIVFIIDFETER